VVVKIAAYSYPLALGVLFVISFGNRPQAFKRFFTVIMACFSLIGIGMIFAFLSRMGELIPILNFKNEIPSLSTFKFIDNQNGFGRATSDSATLMMEAMLLQISSSFQTQLKVDYKSNQLQGWIFVAGLASTFGIYLFASLLQFDVGHMFTSFIQCFILFKF
jgi:hypothetical protein